MTILTIILCIAVAVIAVKQYNTEVKLKDIKRANTALWQIINDRTGNKAKAKRNQRGANKTTTRTSKNPRRK